MRKYGSLAGFTLLFLWIISACSPSAIQTTSTNPSSATIVPRSTPLPTQTPPVRVSPTAPVKVLPAAVKTQTAVLHTARDITYAKIAGVDPGLLSLDVYYTDPITAKRPVVLFIHGGGWSGGDKEYVTIKSEFFTQAGYVFVSANYRLSPQAIFPAHVQDVAKAIAWTVKEIGQFGGDPSRLFLMGHSAGGQLVTLVATDDQYLKSFGLSLTAIKGVISLDTAAYDISDFAGLCKNHVLPAPYSIPFGQDPAVWKFASPVTYVQSGKHIPPIAVIYSGDVGVGSTVSRQLLAENFNQKLVTAGVSHTLFGALDKSHAAINDDFGKPGDKISAQTLAFLKKIDAAEY